jgi:hypothetical protein
MMSRLAIPSLLVLAVVLVARADDKKTDTSGLDQFKQLAGEWEGKEVKGLHPGKEVQIKYKVTAGGSAVVETLFPGTDHEMVSVIHRDGDDLVLTHYCMMGNQPQMRAPAKAEDGKVAFKFAKVTNLKSDKDPYMHDVTFTFTGKDTLTTEWTYFKDAKSAGSVVFELKRKK